MKILRTKRIRTLVVVLLMTILTLSFTANASAATGIYLGAGFPYKSNGYVNTEVRGYVYYNSNTTSQMDVSSLVQYVFNNGNADVNMCEYYVHTPSFSKYTTYTDYITPITKNNYRRMEIDWATICYYNHYNYNTTYSKENNYVYTFMIAANAALGGGEWNTYWFATSPGTNYSANFYY